MRRGALLRRREETLSTSRVAAFLVGLTVVTVLVVMKSVLASVGALIALLIFLFFVLRHARIAKALHLNSVELDLWQTEAARATRQWDKLPALPAVEGLPRHYNDLDLVGERSILRLIQSGITTAGFRQLVGFFGQEGSPATEIRFRQERVKALGQLSVLRRRLLRESRMDVGTLLDVQAVEQFLAEPFHAPDAAHWVLILAGLQGLAVTLAVVYLFVDIPAAYVVPWFISFLVFSLTYPKFYNPFGRAVTVEQTLHRFGMLLGRLESFRLRPGNPLAELFAPFQGEERPSRQLKEIGFWVSLLSIRSHPFIYVFIHLIFPWDFVIGLQLEKLRERLRSGVAHWTGAFAELEALLSLAEFARAFPHAKFPEVRDSKQATPVISARNLKHPLIPEKESIGNGIDLDEKNWCRLITGSNMSGKSTYLRTIGVNTLLAQAGAPVFADSFELAPCRVFTLLRVADSIEDHVSSFYAEVKVLKEILQAAEGEGRLPVLYLVDEIFRGTNNRERLIGSRAYLKRILSTHAGGLVATHDLELAEIAESVKGIQNFHFKESIANGEMRFSYQMEAGPCPTTNALKIMELAGLPVT